MYKHKSAFNKKILKFLFKSLEVLLHKTALETVKNSPSRNDHIFFQTPLFKGEVAEHKPYREKKTTQVATHVQKR